MASIFDTLFGKKKAAAPAAPADIFGPEAAPTQPSTTFKVNGSEAPKPMQLYTPPVQLPKYATDTIRQAKPEEIVKLTPTQEALRKSQMDVNPLVEQHVMARNDAKSLRGVLDDRVLKEGSVDEMVEDAKNKYLTLRYVASTGRGQVQQGFRQAGAEALDTIDLFASPVLGRGGTAFTPENQMKSIERFLQQYAPEELTDVQGMQVADEAVIARQIGAVGSEVVQSLLPAGVAIKAVRALPLIGQLRNAGRTGILAANVIENVAASLAVNAQFTAKTGGGVDDFIKQVAANPSVLLPFGRKSELAVGFGVDYLAGRFLGMSNSQAMLNAASGLGGNTLQRRGVASEIKGFAEARKMAAEEIDRLYAVAPHYLNDPKGMQRQWDESLKAMQQRAKFLQSDSGFDAEKGRKGIERPARPDDVFTPKNPDEQWAASYAAEKTAQREAARTAEKGTFMQRAKDYYLNTIRPIITDTAAPLEDALKRTGVQKADQPRYITNQIDRVLNNNQIAHQFMEDGGLNAVIQEVPKEDYDGLSQYLTAKQATRVSERGKVTGRDLEADKRYVAATKEKYEPMAAKVRQYQRAFLDKMVDYSLISPETRTALIEQNPDYVPLKRIFDDLEAADRATTGQPKKRPLGSLSKQTVVQKLEGSTREIEDPLYSLQQMTELMVSQGERNRLYSMIKDLKDVEGNPFGIEVLRDADNVQERIKLFSEAKELKPVQEKARRLISTRSKWLRKLETELNNLNKKAVTESTRPSKEAPKEKLSSGVKVTAKNGKVKEKLIPATGKPKDIKAFVEELMTLPKSKIEQLKKSMELRDEKSGEIMKELEELRGQYESAAERRGEIFDEAKLIRDTEATGQKTVTGLKNGIKEIISIDPEYANVLKDMNPEQLDWFAKTNRFFARMLKLGATGINLPFAVRNIIKDQFAGSINNEFAIRAGVGLPQAMFEAVGHGELYKKMLREGALFTEFDAYRKPQKASIADTRSRKNMATRAKYVATHPSVWLRTIEDLIGRSEQVGRIQQFASNEQGRIAQGYTPEEASVFAATAARENTGNFRRVMAGNKVLSYLSPYFNAAKEGTRARLRAWKRDPVGTALKSGIEIVLPQVALTLWNLSTPDKEEAYRDIRDSHKNGNMVFVPENPEKGDDGMWTTMNIPLQGQDAALATLARKVVEAMHDQDPLTTRDLFNAMVGMTTPFDPQSSLGGFSSLVPQGIKPILETSVNKDFFRNSDIVPFYLQDEPVEDQRQPWTTETATLIGSYLGVAPAKVEHLLRGYFANNATTALHWGDVLLAAAGVIQKEDIKGTGIAKGIFNSMLRAPGNQQDANQPGEGNIFDTPILGGQDSGDVFEPRIPSSGIGNSAGGGIPSAGVIPSARR